VAMMEVVVYLDGDKVKRKRIGRGWTQRKLAAEAGMSQSTIVLLERRGKVEAFHPSTVSKLSDALGVEPDELLGD
jgi:transcriptional regulator with XRE-family HTH domain